MTRKKAANLPETRTTRSSNRDDQFWHALEKLLEPKRTGKQEPLLRWTCRSTRDLGALLTKHVASVRHTAIANLLRKKCFHVETNRNVSKVSDLLAARNAQFTKINTMATTALDEGRPVLCLEIGRKGGGRLRKGGSKKTPKVKREKLIGQPVPDEKRKEPICCDYEATPDMDSAWEAVKCAVLVIREWDQKFGKRAPSPCVVARFHRDDKVCASLLRMALQNIDEDSQSAMTVYQLPRGISRWRDMEYQQCYEFFPTKRVNHFARFTVVLSVIAGGSGARRK